MNLLFPQWSSVAWMLMSCFTGWFLLRTLLTWPQQFIEYAWLLWATRAHVGTNIYLMFPEYFQPLSGRSLPFPKEIHRPPHFSHHLSGMAVQVFQLLKLFQKFRSSTGPTAQNSFRKKGAALRTPAGFWKQYLEEAHRQKRLIILNFHRTSQFPSRIFSTISMEV